MCSVSSFFSSVTDTVTSAIKGVTKAAGDAVSSLAPKPQIVAQPVVVDSSDPTIGAAETAKTQLGDSGAAVANAAQKKKPRSLLGAAGAAGDAGAANIGTTYAKPTLGG